MSGPSISAGRHNHDGIIPDCHPDCNRAYVQSLKFALYVKIGFLSGRTFSCSIVHFPFFVSSKWSHWIIPPSFIISFPGQRNDCSAPAPGSEEILFVIFVLFVSSDSNFGTIPNPWLSTEMTSSRSLLIRLHILDIPYNPYQESSWKKAEVPLRKENIKYQSFLSEKSMVINIIITLSVTERKPGECFH